MQQPQPGHLAQQQAHGGLIMTQFAHPRRIEPGGVEPRLQLLPKGFVLFTQTHLMTGQMQPWPAGSDDPIGQQFVEQADEGRAIECRAAESTQAIAVRPHLVRLQ
ncbi:hypothetical protein D3C80_1654710 [compost metagenome]